MDGKKRGRRDVAPEARARQIIDAGLAAAGWIVQDRADVNIHAGPGVAARETPTATRPADYLIFLDGRACGVLEAKPEGKTLSGVVRQGDDYTRAAPARYPAWADPLPFVYVSSGGETLFQDARDPLARPRRIFAPHRPETLRTVLAAGSVTGGGEAETVCEDYQPPDFNVITGNKQLNLAQHIMTVLAPDGAAGVVLPNNVLFEGGASEKIRRRRLNEFECHSPLRDADMAEFVSLIEMLCDLAKYEETDRFKHFSYVELAAREKPGLNLTWLREEGGADPASLPPPPEIAASIVEELETALLTFRSVAGRLS